MLRIDRSNPLDCSSLVDHKEMPVLLAERSSSTLMAVGELMAVELSPARTSLRSIDRQPTLLDGSPSLLLTRNSLVVC